MVFFCSWRAHTGKCCMSCLINRPVSWLDTWLFFLSLWRWKCILILNLLQLQLEILGAWDWFLRYLSMLCSFKMSHSKRPRFLYQTQIFGACYDIFSITVSLSNNFLAHLIIWNRFGTELWSNFFYLSISYWQWIFSFVSKAYICIPVLYERKWFCNISQPDFRAVIELHA